jgi:hypothetical protein
MAMDFNDSGSFGFVENVTDTMKLKIHLVHPVSSRRRVFVLKIFIDRSSRPNESLNRLETMKHGYKS